MLDELREYFTVVTRYRQHHAARPIILQEARMLRDRVASARLRVELDRFLVRQEPDRVTGSVEA